MGLRRQAPGQFEVVASINPKSCRRVFDISKFVQITVQITPHYIGKMCLRPKTTLASLWTRKVLPVGRASQSSMHSKFSKCRPQSQHCRTKIKKSKRDSSNNSKRCRAHPCHLGQRLWVCDNSISKTNRWSATLMVVWVWELTILLGTIYTSSSNKLTCISNSTWDPTTSRPSFWTLQTRANRRNSTLISVFPLIATRFQSQWLYNNRTWVL